MLVTGDCGVTRPWLLKLSPRAAPARCSYRLKGVADYAARRTSPALPGFTFDWEARPRAALTLHLPSRPPWPPRRRAQFAARPNARRLRGLRRFPRRAEPSPRRTPGNHPAARVQRSSARPTGRTGARQPHRSLRGPALCIRARVVSARGRPYAPLALVVGVAWRLRSQQYQLVSLTRIE